MTACPHTDPCCPCQDSDPCHYEGPDAMACPTLVLVQKDADGSWWSVGLDGVLVPAGSPHCHCEGCEWPSRCGLRVVMSELLDRYPSEEDHVDVKVRALPWAWCADERGRVYT